MEGRRHSEASPWGPGVLGTASGSAVKEAPTCCVTLGDALELSEPQLSCHTPGR